ncbi:MAG: sigma 54-interacting transcriptional regulator [Planctomycetia bacterium]|nr:sigma 54-interacting transcriptional regulator [Planctomycetia bacterium]
MNTKNKNQEIEILQEISTAVVHERDIHNIIDSILDILSRKMGMHRATLALCQGDTLQIEVSRGLADTEKKRGIYHLGEGITGRVALSGESLCVPDISKDKFFLNRTGAHKKDEHTAFICVPIIRMERIVGTLSVERPSADLDQLEKDKKFLEIIGNLAAEAVAARQLEQEEKEKLQKENESLRSKIESIGTPGKLIGNCRSMRALYEQIRQVAPTDATVLIRGSSGTGKELVANAIRLLSPRKDKPFITLNCAALPENLIESELFGHEKGSFTGAVSQRIGRAEAAGGGTLFLDEIGDLAPSSQVKLLRFLQEKTFSRIGSNEEISSDVRIIAATSRDLESFIDDGKFRLDLFYRLNVFPIHIPDLSKRRCDILLLAEHFIGKYNLRYGKNVKRISQPAINLLYAYQWPGNVRELENCIERAVLTCSNDCINSSNLPPSLQSDEPFQNEEDLADSSDFKTLVANYERGLITDSLKKNKGNMSAAARELNLSPRVIHYKIGILDIHPDLYSGEN